MQIEDIEIELLRKNVCTLRMVVQRNGRLRVTAPMFCLDSHVRDFVIQHLDWIRLHSAVVCKEQNLWQMIENPGITGENLWLCWGVALRLLFIKVTSTFDISIKADSLCVYEPKCYSVSQRLRLLNAWRQKEFQTEAQRLLAYWLQKMGEKRPVELRCRKMVSRWGSCKPSTRQITLNTRLFYYPKSCLEEVIVHELCHFYEGSHNARFYQLLSYWLPGYQQQRELLKHPPAEAEKLYKE